MTTEDELLFRPTMAYKRFSIFDKNYQSNHPYSPIDSRPAASGADSSSVSAATVVSSGPEQRLIASATASSAPSVVLTLVHGLQILRRP